MLFSAVISAYLAVIVSAETPRRRTLGQLANGTWLENILVRPNRAILATQLYREPNIWTVKTPNSRNTSLELVTSLPSGNAAVSITRVHNIGGLESYVVLGGNFSDVEHPIPGHFTAYTLQFFDDEVKLRRIAALGPSSITANGITSSDAHPGVVFIADSLAGVIGRLDVFSGRFEQGLWSYEELRAPPCCWTGVNVLKIYQSHLYWTNSDLTAVYKVPITASGKPVPNAVPQLVADLSKIVTSAVDNLVIDRRGNIYTTTSSDNTVIFSDAKTGESKIVAGGLEDVAQEALTALAIGGEWPGKILLYATTSGGLGRPITNMTEGAKILAITLKTGL
ncbi:hypothetical protein C2857_005311 [Epichloe festucae Fl1]|uniref:Six-bladed beta-propeller-like protein n=1 Tax=Epichloe festucae (strain Fl1) TaxID=877507 RepID=A0A7S9KPN8_EPIFF|nr:hypothetical protein C2857_005311 [Epichloe festucae Fl1]